MLPAGGVPSDPTSGGGPPSPSPNRPPPPTAGSCPAKMRSTTDDDPDVRTWTDTGFPIFRAETVERVPSFGTSVWLVTG